MVTLTVKDHGKGMPPEILDARPDALGKLGVGLRGMRERMRQLGGKLEFFSNGEGTTVSPRRLVKNLKNSRLSQRPPQLS